jgi:hypothetical protein
MPLNGDIGNERYFYFYWVHCCGYFYFCGVFCLELLGPYMKQLILKITHRMWNREISRILCRAYEKQIINSYQLHELLAKFDPTQKHEVYK